MGKQIIKIENPNFFQSKFQLKNKNEKNICCQDFWEIWFWTFLHVYFAFMCLCYNTPPPPTYNTPRLHTNLEFYIFDIIFGFSIFDSWFDVWQMITLKCILSWFKPLDFQNLKLVFNFSIWIFNIFYAVWCERSQHNQFFCKHIPFLLFKIGVTNYLLADTHAHTVHFNTHFLDHKTEIMELSTLL